MKGCPSCQQQNLDEANYCLRCGTSLAEAPNQEEEGTLRSERITRMHELVQSADGSVSLLEKNRELFRNSPAWEKSAMAGLALQKAVEIIRGSFSGEGTSNPSAAKALARVANILDGLPGTEDVVTRYRNAPANSDSLGWADIAREAASKWEKEIKEYRDAAKKMQAEEVKGSGNSSSSGYDIKGDGFLS